MRLEYATQFASNRIRTIEVVAVLSLYLLISLKDQGMGIGRVRGASANDLAVIFHNQSDLVGPIWYFDV